MIFTEKSEDFTDEEVDALKSLIGYGFGHREHTGDYLTSADNAYHKVKTIHSRMNRPAEPMNPHQPAHCKHDCRYKREILNQHCNIPRCQYDTRSNPHTPEEYVLNFPSREVAIEMRDRERAEAARAAILATLDAILKERKRIMHDGKPGLAEFLGKETYYLETLRKQAGEQR